MNAHTNITGSPQRAILLDRAAIDAAVQQGYEALAVLRLAEVGARQLADDLREEPEGNTAASIADGAEMAQARVIALMSQLEKVQIYLARSEGSAGR